MKTRSGLKFASTFALAVLASTVGILPASASSHMDAPLITLDHAANTTDVYAFVVERSGVKFLDVALAVYPHEEPGVGPNKYNFDPNVLYQIFLADPATGADRVAYQFQFSDSYKTQATILQSYTGVVAANGDAAQNFTQTYTVTKVVNGVSTVLGTGTVPPNNQGVATPKYNKGDNGLNVAKDGVSDAALLDDYTRTAVATLGSSGYRSFAGQRDDAFYGDINAIFDLLALRSGSGNRFDSQGGFNVHLLTLDIPLSDIAGGANQTIGVYATTSRRASTVLTDGAGSAGTTATGAWVQVGRQGNPLFCEAFVAIKDKDLYNRTKPTSDATLFKTYSDNPELAALINALVLKANVAPTTGRADLSAIFIPDVIKVDLSTARARLPGGGATSTTPDDAGYSRLSIFGGDVLESPVAGHPFRLPGSAIGADAGKFYVPGGWPNGRRIGEDVIDIGVTAVISDLRSLPLTIRSADGIDNVNSNDVIFNKVFPYSATPHNGHNSVHNPTSAVSPFVAFSARGQVGVGDGVLISGFVVRGSVAQQVLVRGTGPSLAAFGLANAIPDTTLEIYGGPTLVASNDDWKAAQQAAIAATGLAPLNDKESAVLLTVQPGIYTMIVRGKAGSVGTGLVEAFLIGP
ncbi:MAG TPA: DUF4331 domain-containing protein [Opitutaceae bacterium]|nr:DUF4331 domain-containing protein [Opitutaceae bacterium]